MNALDSGADPSGRKDSTDAIQRILDGLCDPSATGVLELPVGDFRITKTLVYRGSYGYGLRIRGACGAAGPSGVVHPYY